MGTEETRRKRNTSEKKDINKFISRDFFSLFFCDAKKNIAKVFLQKQRVIKMSMLSKRKPHPSCGIHEKNIKRASWLNVPGSASC